MASRILAGESKGRYWKKQTERRKAEGSFRSTSEEEEEVEEEEEEEEPEE